LLVPESKEYALEIAEIADRQLERLILLLLGARGIDERKDQCAANGSRRQFQGSHETLLSSGRG
jgi:hypothetical protein